MRKEDLIQGALYTLTDGTKVRYVGPDPQIPNAHKVLDEEGQSWIYHLTCFTTAESTSPLQTQEGGSHYKSMAIQPVEYIHKNGLGFIEGAIIKYISRYKNKNGLEDLKKAKHFIDLLIEMEYGSQS